ncbi:MAG TPA: hypothetical protein VGQ09_17835 [Chitinophagaceae bacterium]|jgi:hypothetical protein|nr:hypothetical protein [Chitinophagaceae bacterium]
MDTVMISLVISILAFIISLSTFIILSRKQKRPASSEADSFNSRPLQLQAYERLVMLAERIALPNLISRANQPGLSVKEMQVLLLENIKQEYEYNMTQQIYVSPVAWEAVKNLKEQSMLVINQVASALPPEATGTDLNKILLDVLMKQQKGQLHLIVLEALNYEARKLMK